MLESEDDEEEDSEAIPDRLSSGDAWMFPIVSSLFRPMRKSSSVGIS